MKSRLVKSHRPCSDCGSSDALSEYSDGHTHCFSCGKTKNPQKRGELIMDNSSTYEFLPWRGVTRDTMQFYGVKTKIDFEGRPVSIIYEYPNGAKKGRYLEKKDFLSTGPMNEANLFGSDKFGAGSAKAITITEGELDALSVFQIMGSKYPVVSVRGASSAARDCGAAYEYLNSFEQIYLCFDNDEAGQRAVLAVSKLFNPDKVRHVKLDRYKDPNDYLTNDAAKEFSASWWSASNFLPKGLVADYQSIGDILSRPQTRAIASYPFKTIDEFSYGIRSGEVVLVTAQEGVGKTELLRAIEYHLLKTTEDNVAIIHLEEQEKRSVQGLVGYELGVPAHLPDAGISVDDQILAFKKLTKKDNRLYVYSKFGSDDPDTILDLVRYLATVCGCKYIFLDHITMIVSGHEGDDERKKLDYISTRLATLTRELEFTLFLVSHVNDDGKTRGSRNISKVADFWIDLSRDTEGGSNRTNLRVRKNRFVGKTGPAGNLIFDAQTYKLFEELPEVEDVSTRDFDVSITPV